MIVFDAGIFLLKIESALELARPLEPARPLKPLRTGPALRTARPLEPLRTGPAHSSISQFFNQGFWFCSDVCEK